MSDKQDVVKSNDSDIGIELSDGVKIRNIEDIRKDMEKTGLSQEEINVSIKNILHQFFTSRVDVDFVNEGENLLSVLRNIKNMIDLHISKKDFFEIDQTLFDIKDEVNKVFKD